MHTNFYTCMQSIYGQYFVKIEIVNLSEILQFEKIICVAVIFSEELFWD